MTLHRFDLRRVAFTRRIPPAVPRSRGCVGSLPNFFVPTTKSCRFGIDLVQPGMYVLSDEVVSLGERRPSRSPVYSAPSGAVADVAVGFAGEVRELASGENAPRIPQALWGGPAVEGQTSGATE